MPGFDDGFIVDRDGNKRILRGVNFAHDAKNRPDRIVSVPPSFWRSLRQDLGLNCVRLAWFWDGLEPIRGRYSEAYLRHIESMVIGARQAGMEVILSCHQDVFGAAFGFAGLPAWLVDERTRREPLSPWYRNYIRSDVRRAFSDFFDSSESRSDFVAAWRLVLDRVGNECIAIDMINEPWFGRPNEVNRQRYCEFHEHMVTELESVFSGVIGIQYPPLWQRMHITSRCNGVRTVAMPHWYAWRVEAGVDFRAKNALADAMRRIATCVGNDFVIGEFGFRPSIDSDGRLMKFSYDLLDVSRRSACVWDVGMKSEYSVVQSDLSPSAHYFPCIRPYPNRLQGDNHIWQTKDRVFEFRWSSKKEVVNEIIVPNSLYIERIDSSASVSRHQSGLRVESCSGAHFLRLSFTR